MPSLSSDQVALSRSGRFQSFSLQILSTLKKLRPNPLHPSPTGSRNIEPSTAATKSQIGAKSNLELERDTEQERDSVRRDEVNGGAE
uniref:Uncharacterized protein n=1 Tax=Fagus sylvatica TaxID=28930 RepID=A0A2N9G014_FAGSY